MMWGFTLGFAAGIVYALALVEWFAHRARRKYHRAP